MIFGVDALASNKYQKPAANKVKGLAFGIFYDTFGDANKFILQLAKSRKYPLIRVQGVWKDGHDFNDKDRARAIEIAKKLQKICIAVPGQPIYYSPFCEHDKNAKYMEKLFKEIRAVAPSLILVNAPSGHYRGQYVDCALAINEVHHDDAPAGNKGERFAFSFDGMNAADADVEKYKKANAGAIYFMIWNQHLNLTYNAKKKLPRPQLKYRPDGKFLQSMVYLTETKLQSSFTSGPFKSHSEQDHENDRDGNKVVILIKHKGSVALRAHGTNKILANLKYTGPEVDHDTRKPTGRHIFRGGKWGFQYYKQAKKAGGDGRVDILLNGAVLGVQDPRFRGGGPGDYRNVPA